MTSSKWMWAGLAGLIGALLSSAAMMPMGILAGLFGPLVAGLPAAIFGFALTRGVRGEAFEGGGLIAGSFFVGGTLAAVLGATASLGAWIIGLCGGAGFALTSGLSGARLPTVGLGAMVVIGAALHGAGGLPTPRGPV